MVGNRRELPSWLVVGDRKGRFNQVDGLLLGEKKSEHLRRKRRRDTALQAEQLRNLSNEGAEGAQEVGRQGGRQRAEHEGTLQVAQ